MVHEEIRKSKGDDIFASFGRGNKLAIPYFEELKRAIEALRDSGMMVVILCHSKVKQITPRWRCV